MFFKWNQIKNHSRALTFADVLLAPNQSDISSRKVPCLKTALTKKKSLEIPFISANMDTITEDEMSCEMHRLGGAGILHRFLPLEEQVEQVKKLIEQKIPCVIASTGVNSEGEQRAEQLVKAGVHVLTIDIAHGHSIKMFDFLSWIKKEFPHIEVIAGNVATVEGALDLIERGADAIKVGIGPGSMCTTRIITGCGMPQLTAIALCTEEAKKHNIPVIADGGIRHPSDVVKALAAGANTVMLGSVLSGTLETPGKVKKGCKMYRGMASQAAQKAWRGDLQGLTPEGESCWVPVKGRVEDVLTEFSGGLKSGMSYLGARTVLEIYEKARFVEISSAGQVESVAHGL